MKPQILLIHGGTTFDTYDEYLGYLKSSELTLDKINRPDWKNSLQANLLDFEVVYPKMPNSKNARYEEWKIWLEKIIPLLQDGVILVGHSLGGIFLAKYLTENSCSKKIDQIHLVAAPYDMEIIKESLADFTLSDTVGGLEKFTDKIFLYQSKDDTAVAYKDVLKYQRDLPGALLQVFTDRGHFLQATFPELVSNIKNN